MHHVEQSVYFPSIPQAEHCKFVRYTVENVCKTWLATVYNFKQTIFVQTMQLPIYLYNLYIVFTVGQLLNYIRAMPLGVPLV